MNSWMMEGYLLHMSLWLITLSSLPLVFTESHSHFFFTTVTNDSTYNYPSYYTTRSLDDIPLYWYDSDDAVIQRRVPWFKSTSSNLLLATIEEYNFQQMLQMNFEVYRNYMNDTNEFQVLQLLDGCTLYDDGTFDTIFSFQYNGEPFLRFDVENGSWAADNPKAQVFCDANNVNKTILQKNKEILQKACVPHIIELLSLGKCTFNRREQPNVVVTQMPITNSTSTLSCRAYGHYPKKISMTFFMNGEPVPDSLMELVTLPFPDLTYLTWLSMIITPTEDDVYTCNVAHSSLTSPLMARLSGDSSDLSSGHSNYNVSASGISIGGIIGICLAVAVLVVSIVFGSVWWTNNRRQ